MDLFRQGAPARSGQTAVPSLALPLGGSDGMFIGFVDNHSMTQARPIRGDPMLQQSLFPFVHAYAFPQQSDIERDADHCRCNHNTGQ